VRRVPHPSPGGAPHHHHHHVSHSNRTLRKTQGGQKNSYKFRNNLTQLLQGKISRELIMLGINISTFQWADDFEKLPVVGKAA